MRALTTGDTAMPRPRSERRYNGVRLADWLYPFKRNGKFIGWRYRRPDGSFKHFYAPTVEQANKIAEANNAKRNQPRDSLSSAIERYIEYRESNDSGLVGKRSWQNRKYALEALGQDIITPVNRITREQVKLWWESLTFHQQKQRKAECRRLFGWLMGEGLSTLPYNPFTTNSDMPLLLNAGTPEKARQRLTRDDFWAIYAAAGELGYQGLQIAMGLSLTTFMREGDLCSLKLSDNLEGRLLRLVVGKSLAQRGSTQAARLQWDVGSHQMVKSLLSRSRELSMANFRCPFVISHKPKAIRQSNVKEHCCQILPRMLIAQFAEARTATGIKAGEASTAPTFHEIRSLASKLAADAGYNVKEIQSVMAHESEATTRAYQEGHSLPFDTVGVVFTEDMVGGSFK